MTSAKLPDFPDAPENYPRVMHDKLPLTSMALLVEFERARADAAMARLRVAVDAMKEIRSVHPLMHNGGNWDKFVNDVLARIGPLPPLPEREAG